jgi:hypothetical protein
VEQYDVTENVEELNDTSTINFMEKDKLNLFTKTELIS